MSNQATASPFVYPDDEVTRSFGIVSTFPPTSCGIATFSAALTAGLIGNGGTVDVVRLGEAPEFEDALVLGSIESATPEQLGDACKILNRTDAVIIQHEYGLYDGVDGDSVINLMAGIDVPIMVVAHTVLSEPTPSQRRVLEGVCDAADVVIVMTMTAHDRLLEHFRVESSKVVVIPHGAATPLNELAHPRSNDRPRLLTWGLLGPGKGIEWGIDAVAKLTDLNPRPRYVIAGATHPNVVSHFGEAYRDMLTARAAQSSAAADIEFDDSYRGLTSLTKLIHSADIVVLPYDSTDQVTSGVLVDAVAAGRPVVSTAFPHAIELLASGAGIVVPQRDPQALADAIRSILTDQDLADSMAAEARRLAPSLSWTAVAAQYDEIAEGLLTASRTIRL